MSKKLLRIPIDRFEANKALKEDLYLEFPKNKKNIKLSLCGDSLDEAFLIKMRTKGVTYLCFFVEEEDTRDPLTCEIFQTSGDVTPNPITSAPDSKFEPSPIETKVIAPVQVEATQVVEKPILVEEEEKRFQAENEVETQQIIKTNKESIDEPEQRFSNEIETTDEPEQRFSPTKAKKDDSEFRFNSSNSDESKKIVSGAKEKKEKEVEFRFNSSSTKEDTLETRIISKKESKTAEDEIKTFSADSPSPSNNEVLKVKSLEQLKNAALEGKDIDINESKQQLIQEAKAQIAASNLESKIAELKIKNISNGSEEQKEEIQLLERKLKKAAIGKMESDLEEEINDSSELKALSEEINKEKPSNVELALKIQQITEIREVSSKKLKEAIEDEKIALTRTHGTRDAPQTITKLVAYLASSIGYTNLDFLTDLGFGAIVQFQQRMGADIKTTSLTGFAQRALAPNQSQPNSLIDDYLQILKFMEIYTTDPLIDFKEREFSKRIFERALEKTKNSTASPDPISLTRWVNFLEKGPTLEIHSLCSKASAKAVKAARDVSII
jgi:hypothetical protein